jgi:hypothetical protein
MAAVRSLAPLSGVTEAVRRPFYGGRPGEKPEETLEGGFVLSILWIILIVVLVLALLGFFSRGAW